MKIVKMSLAAAMLCSASAFAIDNVKVDGDFKLFYQTADSSVKNTESADLFHKDASHTNFELRLGATADLTEGVSAGATLYNVFTLGVENYLVSGTWSNTHTFHEAEGASFADGLLGTPGYGLSTEPATWLGEIWLAGTAGKTTLKLGRMALDTPLAFSESWGMTKNTFGAIVLINQDIKDTTLVATAIGMSNGVADDEAALTLNDVPGVTIAGYVAQDGKFSTFRKDGVYCVGAVTTAIPNTTAQAWYYDLVGQAKAYWVQADVAVDGILAGAQFAEVSLDAANTKDTDAYAVVLGYEMKDVATFKAAYSSVADDGSFSVNNTATGGQSKLYTELWWTFAAGNAANDTIAVTVEGKAGGTDLFAGYYNVDIDPKVALVDGDQDGLSEYVVTAGRTYGPLDVTAALIYDDYSYKGTTPDGETEDDTLVQVYLTYNF